MTITLRLHRRRPQEKERVVTDRVIYTRPLSKIFNATSFTGFHLRKRMPLTNVIWYGTKVSVFSFIYLSSNNVKPLLGT